MKVNISIKNSEVIISKKNNMKYKLNKLLNNLNKFQIIIIYKVHPLKINTLTVNSSMKGSIYNN